MSAQLCEALVSAGFDVGPCASGPGSVWPDAMDVAGRRHAHPPPCPPQWGGDALVRGVPRPAKPAEWAFYGGICPVLPHAWPAGKHWPRTLRKSLHALTGFWRCMAAGFWRCVQRRAAGQSSWAERGLGLRFPAVTWLAASGRPVRLPAMPSLAAASSTLQHDRGRPASGPGACAECLSGGSRCRDCTGCPWRRGTTYGIPAVNLTRLVWLCVCTAGVECARREGRACILWPPLSHCVAMLH